VSNPLYWEDHVSSTAGGQTEMIVDTHHASFTVTYGVGKYDHVLADHSNLIGTGTTGVCEVCDRGSNRLRFGICESCQFTQHRDEQRRMANDQPMGDHKRSPITLDTRSRTR
jgi:hypothetical protein